MLPEVTQKNVHIFFPFKIAKIAVQIARKENISVTQAVEKFYNSKTEEKLADESTKLWQLGWVGLYDIYKAEQNDR